MTKLKWWGYKHTSGSYHAKRYFGELDIKEAQESPFVERYCEPFEAQDHKDAMEFIKKMIP